MASEHFKWKVVAVTQDTKPERRMLGKVLGWMMSEAEARDHERVNGRKLEKVAGSGWTPSDAGSGQGWSDNRPLLPGMEKRLPPGKPVLSDPGVPKGQYLGERIDLVPVDEREHFMQCPECGGWFDKRDLGEAGLHFERGHKRPEGS